MTSPEERGEPGVTDIRGQRAGHAEGRVIEGTKESAGSGQKKTGLVSQGVTEEPGEFSN